MAESLDELRREMLECDRCPLAKTRTNLVFGVGCETAELMFVGEAPGFHEDQQGEPFVGAAGQLLDKLLASIGLVRDQVYIGNVLKCRPPDNRDPLPEEIDHCEPFLAEQIRLIGPKVVSTLGNHATKLILETKAGITKIHGQKFVRPDYIVFPIYHPAAALYTPSYLEALEEDFAKLKEILAEDFEPPQPEPEQISLF